MAEEVAKVVIMDEVLGKSPIGSLPSLYCQVHNLVRSQTQYAEQLEKLRNLMSCS